MESSGRRPVRAGSGQIPLGFSPIDESRPIRIAERLDPPFRWPGGKRWLVDALLRLIPTDYGRFYEPFFGGGALFWALRPATATLSDSNRELMSCYAMIRDRPSDVSHVLSAFGQDSETYYRIRSERPIDEVTRAARLIYLTTLAFNGLHRVNKAGDFNVPYGRRRYDRLRDASFLIPYADALRGMELVSVDFETAVGPAMAGDVVYLDPPYTVAHGNNGFVRYNERIFSWMDQQRLATVARELADRGCVVIVSNADHDSIRELYPDFIETPETRLSAMAAGVKFRGDMKEMVLSNVG